MPLASLGFLVGVLMCQSLAELPLREWCFLIIIIVPITFRFPKYRLLLFLTLGFLYSVLIAHSKLAGQLPPALEGHDLLATGVIASIPHKSAVRSRFWFDISDLSELPQVNKQEQVADINKLKSPRRIQLTWYKNAPSLAVGQRWQLQVRLKRPRGFSNPGAFDYESWLYQHDIHATGYVRGDKSNTNWNQRLGEETGPIILVQQLRERLSSQISNALQEKPHASLISALVVGDRQHMTDQQWKVLTKNWLVKLLNLLRPSCLWRLLL